MKQPEHNPRAPRLDSLDALRGMALAGMVLVNTPGSWAHIPPVLRHAAWHGCLPADLVFPFFLFVSGVALACALAGKPSAATPGGIVRRVLILFGLGLCLNALAPLLHCIAGAGIAGFRTLRIMGVLQRIALAWGLAAYVTTRLRPSAWLPVAACMLLGHWMVLSLLPGCGQLTPAANAAGFIDRAVLGVRHLYRQGPVDPEGLLGTLPAAASVLLGACTGHWLQRRARLPGTSARLLAAGAVGIAGGLLWATVLPLNKTLWTGSFVLYSTGWALGCLAVLYQLLDVRCRAALGMPLAVLGRNALCMYVGASALVRLLLFMPAPGGMSLYGWIYTVVFCELFGKAAGSAAFSLAFLFCWWLVLFGMYKRRWFVRI